MRKRIFFSLIVLHTSLVLAQPQATNFPEKHWQQYVNPEEAGFAAAKLDTARAYFDASEAAGFLLVHRGRILASWGETNRRFMCASIRKSFMSALMGIAVQQGKIDLNQTLRALHIDDLQALTETEKQATVRHLLTATSGIYLPSAYSPRGMEKNLPARGSHAPGEFWYYNNWDFNALATIFMQETGQDVFAAFKAQIAGPLQMEDFRLEDTYYRFETDKSKHPAYLFRMSARDMARFGWLYLNNGKWRNKQIIPAKWIAESTQPITRLSDQFQTYGNYGYLWWVSNGIRGEKMYFASGNGGQKICVFPEADLIAVHVVDTYQNNEVSFEHIVKLLELVLDARVGTLRATPHLVTASLFGREFPKTIAVTQEALQQYVGTFRHPLLGKFIITNAGDHLVMETGIGIYPLLHIGEHRFWPPDIETPILFRPAATVEKKHTVESLFDGNRKVTQVVFYY